MSEPNRNLAPGSALTALESWVRTLIREEIQAAMGRTINEEVKLLYNTKEAARLLGVPETWLGRAARQGLVPCVRMGHYVNFNPEDLREFIGKLRKENT